MTTFLEPPPSARSKNRLSKKKFFELFFFFDVKFFLENRFSGTVFRGDHDAQGVLGQKSRQGAEKRP